MGAPSTTLGRGLESLLKPQARPTAREAATLPLDSIQPGPSQPRATIREDQLQELAASIRVSGVIQPIVVRPIAGSPDRYEIVAGERRWRAARLAGLTDIPAVVRSLSDQDAIAVALIENIQRENLTPAEEARSLQRLIAEFSLTHVEVAQAVGRSRAAVSNLLRLLDLPTQVLDLVESRALGMGHARALLGLSSAADRTRIGALVAERGLSVRATETLIRRELAAVAVDPPSKPESMVVSDVLATPAATVRLHQGPGGAGRLVIEYKDTVIRDEVLDALRDLFDGFDTPPR